jgi:hypothetical protein
MKSESDKARAEYYFKLNWSSDQVKHEENQVLNPDELVVDNNYEIKRVEEKKGVNLTGRLKILEVDIERDRFRARYFRNSDSVDNNLNGGWTLMSSYGIVSTEVNGKKVYGRRNYLVKII